MNVKLKNKLKLECSVIIFEINVNLQKLNIENY